MASTTTSSAPSQTPSAAATPAAWTCPFCPLLCDGFSVEQQPGQPLRLRGSDCPRAQAGLATFTAGASSARARVDGREASLDEAVAVAARLLAASRQPLAGGLATDVAGARALYRLACASGAICDAASGEALTQGLRVLQDRGGFTVTLAEMRSRADLVVMIGGDPIPRFPLFFERALPPAGAARQARVVSLAAAAASDVPAGAGAVATGDDLFDTLGLLCALLAGPQLQASAPAPLRELAEQLQAAHYAVLVFEPARLGPQAALLIETIQRIVGTLNQKTRAAAMALGGVDGAATVQQVFGWLSGLPLRSRVGPRGLEHEPLAFGSAHLLAGGAVDALLWVASFGALPPPPETAALARVLIGHPALAAEPAQVFIPVATPGIGADGHLFRTDGLITVPLWAQYADGLPTVAAVLDRISDALARVGDSGEGAR